jgi:hypothetical protein
VPRPTPVEPGKIVPFSSPKPIPKPSIPQPPVVGPTPSPDPNPSSETNPNDDVDDNCPGSRCKPCVPPVGSQYHWIQLPNTRQRGRHAWPPYNDGHVKIWTVHQSKFPACECFINETVQDHTQVGPAGSIEVFAKPPKPTGGGPIYLP